jgi:hypothetical protein
MQHVAFPRRQRHETENHSKATGGDVYGQKHLQEYVVFLFKVRQRFGFHVKRLRVLHYKNAVAGTTTSRYPNFFAVFFENKHSGLQFFYVLQV